MNPMNQTDAKLEALDPKWQYYKTEDGRYLVYSKSVLAIITQREQAAVTAFATGLKTALELDDMRFNYPLFTPIADGIERAVDTYVAQYLKGDQHDQNV